MRDFMNYQAIIYLLNNDKLRNRHWLVLQEKTGVTTDEEHWSFRMNTFLSLDQSFFEGVISEVIDIAQEEAMIEDELTVIRLRWEDRKFVLNREPITMNSSSSGSSSSTSGATAAQVTQHKLTVINQISSLHEDVEQDDVVIDKMIHNSKSAFFRPDLEKMKAVLAEITSILKTWIATQENCLILARVLLTFVSADIREVEEIRNNFEQDFKQYNKLMEEVAKKPIVSKCCLMPERRKMLREYKSKFLAHKMACRKLTEMKQKSLPRLSFLSDQESLILLGGLTGDGDVFQRVVRKILGQGFGALHFETSKTGEKGSASSPGGGGGRDTTANSIDSKTAGGGIDVGGGGLFVSQLESLNGEVLQIFRQIDCRQPTDVWLGQLIDEMRRSIKNAMRRSLRDGLKLENYEFADYKANMELVSIAKLDIVWTTNIEDIFKAEHPMDEIKNAYQSLTKRVNALCTEIVASNTSTNTNTDNNAKTDQVTQRKLKNFLSLLLSRRRQLYLFLQKNITSTGDFGWKSTFRLVWKKEQDEVEARQGLGVQKFCHEYQAAMSVPISTQCTVRAQYAMFNALHEYKPIYLKGSVFSGKSAIVSELAFRLGRLLVFLDLSPSFKPKDMVQSLQGLCRSNCWAHYDGMDLLDYETLSILTTQVQQINLAQSMNLKEFHLSGQKTQLGLQTGFFFISRNCETMLDRQGKQSLMQLPPISLTSQFREVYLQKPDFSPIVQAELLARGFEKSKNLTASIIAILNTLYKIASPSFRAIPKMSIVRELFANLGSGGSKIDESNMRTAMVLTMKTILPKQDMDIFMPYMSEHFPKTSSEVADASAVAAAASNAGGGTGTPTASTPAPMATDGDQAAEQSKQFELQIASRIDRGKWPTILGEMGVGKSTAIAKAVASLSPPKQNAAVGEAPAEAANSSALAMLKYAILEVCLARHSVSELFGQEDETGKWNHGIISRLLSLNAKPTVVVLVSPMSLNVAHILASMFDRGVFETEGNHSFPIPKQVKFVFETTSVQDIPSILLARTSVMHMPLNCEVGTLLERREDVDDLTKSSVKVSRKSLLIFQFCASTEKKQRSADVRAEKLRFV